MEKRFITEASVERFDRALQAFKEPYNYHKYQKYQVSDDIQERPEKKVNLYLVFRFHIFRDMNIRMLIKSTY